MAKVIVTESSLENIADAIRAKLGTQTQYKPNQMASAIGQIHGEPVLETLSATANGTYNPSSGKDGFSQAVVNVPNTYALADEGKVVSNGALVAQTSQSITQNGTYDTTLNDEVVVNVAGGGGGGSQIIKSTSSPTSNDGSNNDLFIKYHEGYLDTTYTSAIKNLAMTSNDYTDSDGYRFIASASSVYNNLQPYLAFNGTPGGNTECWHPNSGTPQWLQLQFPQKIIIEGFTIYNRTSNVEHPTAFTVQGSDDGANWTDLIQVSWTETGSNLHKDVVVPSTANGFYYYRWYITGVTSSPYGVISEIDFTNIHEPGVSANIQIADETFVKLNGAWEDIIGANVLGVN